MTVADGSIFQKIMKTVPWDENVRRYYFYPGITMMKL